MMKKILIIEDEILILNSLKLLFELNGAIADTTTSGNEAILKIKTKNYDKIICDLMLQDITGFDVLEEAKLQFDLQEISSKFIIMTAYSSEQILLKANKYNCQVLTKPFENINDTIQKILNEIPNE
jgi:CheY-like chemotaxis protein